MAQTAVNIVRELLQLTGELPVEGTATAAANGSLTDGGLANIYPDDHFNNARIYIVSGTGSGGERLIADYTGSTGVFTVASNWTTNPSTDSVYIVYREFTMSQLRRFVRMAVEALRTKFLIPTKDEAVALTGGATPVYEYTFPTGFVAVREIFREVAAGGGDFRRPLPLDAIRIYQEPAGTPKFLIDREWAVDNGFILDTALLQIIGWVYETEPTTDASNVRMNTVDVLHYAAHQLHLSLVRGDDGDSRHHQRMSQQLLGVLSGLNERSIPAGAKWVIYR